MASSHNFGYHFAGEIQAGCTNNCHQLQASSRHLCPLSASAFSMTGPGKGQEFKEPLGNVLCPQHDLMVQNKMGVGVAGSDYF